MAVTDKTDGQNLSAADWNSIKTHGLIDDLGIIKAIEQTVGTAVPEANFDDVTWDSFIDNTKDDAAGSTNIYLNVTNNSVILEWDDTAAASKSLDFTGASLPAGWAETDSSTGTASMTYTWDAVNDEDDVTAATGASGDNALGTIETTDATYGPGIYKMAIRNITIPNGDNPMPDDYRYIALKKGTNWIRLQKEGTSTNFVIEDSVGNTASLGAGTPTVVWFKMWIRTDGSLKTQYSTAGDSGYATLSDVDTGASTSNSNFKCDIDVFDSNFNTSVLFSLFHLSRISTYELTGNYTRDAKTSSSTIVGVTMADVGSTKPANTAINMKAAADGSTYETPTRETYHSFTATGTSFRLRGNLTTSDGVSTPTLKFLGAKWDT